MLFKYIIMIYGNNNLVIIKPMAIMEGEGGKSTMLPTQTMEK